MKSFERLFKDGERRNKGILLVSVLLLVVLASKNSYADLYYFAKGGLSLRCEPNVCQVSNIPPEIRDVPKHEDDWWVSDEKVAPIKDSRLNYPYASLDLDGVLGLGYLKEPFEFQLGIGVRYPLAAFPTAIERRNYTNAPGTSKRGYGAALTYYSFPLRGLSTDIRFLGMSPRVFLRLLKMRDEKSAYFLEYAIEKQGISIENGWDRWDELERWHCYKITDLTKHIIKIGITNIFGVGPHSGFYLGYVIEESNPTSLGKEAKIKAENHWVSGLYVKIW